MDVDNFILGDILNTTQRTKLDELHDVLFFNVKSLLPTENSDNISVEQVSFLIKEGVLVSFQEKKSDFFTHIRERIRTHSGIVRTKKSDYLLFLLFAPLYFSILIFSIYVLVLDYLALYYMLVFLYCSFRVHGM